MAGGAFCWSFIDSVLPGKPQRKTKNPLLPCFGEISDILSALSNQRSAVWQCLHVGGPVEEGSWETFEFERSPHGDGSSYVGLSTLLAATTQFSAYDKLTLPHAMTNGTYRWTRALQWRPGPSPTSAPEPHMNPETELGHRRVLEFAHNHLLVSSAWAKIKNPEPLPFPFRPCIG